MSAELQCASHFTEVPLVFGRKSLNSLGFVGFQMDVLHLEACHRLSSTHTVHECRVLLNLASKCKCKHLELLLIVDYETVTLAHANAVMRACVVPICVV